MRILKNKMNLNRRFFMIFMAAIFLCTGCKSRSEEKLESSESMENRKVVATSTAIVDICDKLDINLVGVPKSSIYEMPKRYKDARIIGAPMAPDMEVLADISPDFILSPATLKGDLEKKYQNINTDYAFVNLKSVPSLYKSIEELGKLFHKESRAEAIVSDFEFYYDEFSKRHEGKDGPKVLLLMGLPGSYVIATENSYAGSLVELAGGHNVYSGTDKDFLNVNTEDMIKKEPDIILRTAHAMPDDVMKMFADDFEKNDIWKHFEAVKEGKVYDLPHGCFGMSAKFNYKDALEYLDGIFYEN